MKRYGTIPTPLGEMIAVEEEGNLRRLWFVGQKYAPAYSAGLRHDPDSSVLASLREQLDAYFAGRLREFNLPVAPEGTPFQQAVWALLRGIPPGTTTTYGALARELAAGKGGRVPAPQAVGQAVGHNPIAIVIPCHRVVGADGSLTGYAGGLDRKAALLAMEGSGGGELSS